MNTTENSNHELDIESGAYKLGEQFFQSYLLAGERYLNSGFMRESTDEMRFAEFYGELQTEHQEMLQGYFKRQATLDLAQRTAIMPQMVPLQIQEPLTFESTSRVSNTAPSMRATMLAIEDWRADLGSMLADNPGLVAAPPVRPKPAPRAKKLQLRLEELHVANSQDAVWRFNKTDEVSLGVVTIDETGDVKRHNHNLGQIKEGKRKSFGNFQLASFDLAEGGTDRWPKTYTTQVYAVERDGGGLNELLDKASDFIKKKVNEELIAAGLIAGGAKLGIPIPPQVAKIVANVLKGFFDRLIDWFADLFSNDDDILGQQTRVVSLQSFTDGWGSSNSMRSPSWNWTFAGNDGRWVTRMHWQLTNSAGAES